MDSADDEEFHLVDHEPHSFDLTVTPVTFMPVPVKLSPLTYQLEARAEEELEALRNEMIACKAMSDKQVATISTLQKRVAVQETAIEHCTISLMSTTVQHQKTQETVAELEAERDKLLAHHTAAVTYLRGQIAELQKANPEAVNESQQEDLGILLGQHSALVVQLKTNLASCQTALTTLRQDNQRLSAASTHLEVERAHLRDRLSQLEGMLRHKAREFEAMQQSRRMPTRPIDQVMHAAHGPPRAFMHEVFDQSMFR